MTSSALPTSPSKAGTATVNLRWFRIGAWLWIVTGVGHNSLDLIGRAFPTDAEKSAQEALRAIPLDFMGMGGDYARIVNSFSLLMGTAVAVAGVMVLFIARLTAERPGRARPACLFALAASLALFAMSAFMLQLPPPIVTFALASLAFAAALFVRRRGEVR